MAVYFFHLYNAHETLLDPEGREIEPQKVQTAALNEAREMISADARAGCIDLNQRIEVKDDTGTVIHRIDFTDAVKIVGAAGHA
jgi:hypothetical protein